jgi:hypothetical protein
VEDPIQLLSGNLALVGVVLFLLGCWLGWPRHVKARGAITGAFSIGRSQTLLGVVIAVLGLVLLTFGLVAHPVY